MRIFIFVLLHFTNRYLTDRTYMYYSIRPMNWRCIRIQILDHTILVSNNRRYPCAPSYPHHTRPFTTPRLLSSPWGPGFFINKLKAGVVGAFLNCILIYILRNSSTHPKYPVRNFFTFLQSTCEGATSRKSNSYLARQIASTWQGCFRLNSRVHPPSRATPCRSNGVDLDDERMTGHA